jgi:hypothetical protein
MLINHQEKMEMSLHQKKINQPKMETSRDDDDDVVGEVDVADQHENAWQENGKRLKLLNQNSGLQIWMMNHWLHRMACPSTTMILPRPRKTNLKTKAMILQRVSDGHDAGDEGEAVVSRDQHLPIGKHLEMADDDEVIHHDPHRVLPEIDVEKTLNPLQENSRRMMKA